MYPKPPRSTPLTTVRRRVIIIEEPVTVPAALQQVVTFCPHHALPLPMRFHEASLNPQGQFVAVYCCSERHCHHRQLWTLDPRTGRPRPCRQHQPRLPQPEDFSF